MLMFILLGAQVVFATATTPNSTYCNMPPYLTTASKPNIHFIFDHSGSFGFYPYVLQNYNSANSNKTTVPYPSTTGFYGYFEKDKYYKYASVTSGSVTTNAWAVNTACTADNDLIGGKTSGQQCISGNLLNFVTTSRIDIIRKIMTGGRLLSGTTDVFQHEGENQFGGYSGGTLINPFAENTLKCKFHIDRSSTYNVDNDGTSPFTHDATLSIYNNVVMTLTTNGETIAIGTSSGKTTFTRSASATPNIPTRSFVDDGWTSGMVLTATGFSNSGNSNKSCTIASVTATKITCNAALSGITAETTAGVDLIQSTTLDSSNTCVLGTVSNAKIQVQGTAPGTTTGLIPYLYPNLADIEFSFFSNGSTATTPDVMSVAYDGTYGQTAYSTVKNQSLNNYLNALNYSRLFGGTPTGTAMAAAQNFFQQSAVASTTSPSSGTTLINKGNAAADPYYDSVSGSSVAIPCRKTFVMLVSDGQFSAGTDPTTYAYAMHVNDQRADLTGKQLVTTYAIFAFEGATSTAGANSMKSIAAYGGFEDKDADGLPYSFSSPSSQTSTGITWPRPNCDPSASGTWNASCAEWDKSKTGLPYNYYEADNGDALELALGKAVQSILGKVSSGTAASILGNNDNNGSSLLQAMFYPEKTFAGTTKAEWVGELQAFWYYIDPTLTHITIREDAGSDKKLILTQDRIAEFVFDGSDTNVNLYMDTLGNGTKNPTTVNGTATPDTVLALWKAGSTLWSRSYSDRTIFTNDPTASTATKLTFDTASATVTKLYPYLDVTSTLAPDVINYIRGSDVSSAYRKRTVPLTSGGSSNAWKLGDIIDSTPKILSEVRLNSYNLAAPNGYADLSYDKYTKSYDYNARGVAYVGANDGMLHAFKVGTNFIGSTRGTVAEIKNADGTAATDLGKELWAFIPKNMLPYLQYLGDFDNVGYRHVYYVDQTPLLVDASISPTKYRSDASTVLSCDGTSSNPFSSCARVTNTTLDSNKRKQLSYDISSDPTTVGASKGTSWRTILLGSTGLGGATRNSQAVSPSVSITVNSSANTFTRSTGSFVTDGWAVGKKFKASKFTNAGNNNQFTITAVTATVITCSGATGLVTETAVADLVESAVKTPIADPVTSTKGYGYSSYFALDVTEPIVSDLSSGTYPKLLWEFSDPALGITNSTPAVVRIKDANDNNNPPRNGNWYVVIASGPTGPINTGYNQFLGYSDQSLTIWVLDLKTGTVVRTFSSAPTSSTNTNFTLNNAFAGTLSNATIDTDKMSSELSGNYSDDAIYIGYTRLDSTAGTWTKGGVLRILTYNSPNPANWKIYTLIDGVGPVTSAVTKLQDTVNKKLWVYFGTGRYFFKLGGEIDDASSQQALYGIKDPCYISTNTFDPSCTTSTLNLYNETSISTFDTSKDGWYINLDTSTTGFLAERVITDPIATSTGVVFFTTFMPTTDVCKYGGQSSLWAVKYDSGGEVGFSHLKGQALIQLSTGAFQQVDLSSAFSGRKTSVYTGVPPKNPPAITSNANHFPTKRILHIRER